MSSLRPIPVTAFVDWNSQIHNANPSNRDHNIVAKHTLEYVGAVIGRTLCKIAPSTRFDVSLRIYHGWHKGFEPTANRRALATVANGSDFLSLSTKINVAIRPNFSYGDCLISAVDKRLHEKLGIHLPNTLRRNIKTREFEEKMVDTAIAADVVDFAHREPSSWIVVMAEDDDIIPPVFVAEAIRGTRNGRVVMIRRKKDGVFLRLDGIREGI